MVKFGFQELTSFQTKERERDRGESSQWQTAIVIYPLWKRCISSSSPPPVRPISSPRNFEILNVTSSQDRDYGLEGKVSPELFNTQRIARSSVFLIPKRPSRRTIKPSRISSFSPLNIFPRIFLSFSFFFFSRLRGSFFTHDRNLLSFDQNLEFTHIPVKIVRTFAALLTNDRHAKLLNR